MKLVALIFASALALSACATGGAERVEVKARGAEVTEAPSPSEVLDAQLDAIKAGDIDAASAPFAKGAIFSGPGVDEVASDHEAKALAAKRFSALAEAGFSPSKPLVLLGGEDLPGVRWAVYRFGSKGEPWVVTTLMSGPEPWTILAQSWDRPDDDQLIISKALSGELPQVGAFPDSIVPTDPALEAWIDAKRAMPTRVNIRAPLRGDTFGVRSAGEFMQSDEALLITQANEQRHYEAGHIRIDPLDGAGRLLRMTPDKRAGVALYHTGVIVETPQGEVTLPMRALSYFLLQSTGPRLIGGHFMATP